MIKHIALSSLVILAAGCASAPNVRIDKDPATDIRSYQTFSFYDHAGRNAPQYSTLIDTRLREATRSELEKLGYRYDETAPQLRVNFIVKIVDKHEVRATPAGFYRPRAYAAWGGYPYNVDTMDYKAGTLSVDLVDARKNTLVWQGVAEGKLTRESAKNQSETAATAVHAIFKEFPKA